MAMHFMYYNFVRKHANSRNDTRNCVGHHRSLLDA